MDPSRNAVHIVFICDENYVVPTVVAISSLRANKARNTAYTIHILADQISNSSHAHFNNLADEDFQIDIIDKVQTTEMMDSKIQNLHVSTAALYKFHIANIFSELDKILYLDSDLLIQNDLSELFDTDLTGKYAAVVKDYKPMTYSPPQTEKLNITHSAYFNSGVMLLNLRKMREDFMQEKLMDYRKNGINYFMDQDALNVVFQEKVRYLPFRYNVMSSVMGFFGTNQICKYYEMEASLTKEEIYHDAAIVHLCTKFKPWQYSNIPFSEEWKKYYDLSGMTDDLNRKQIKGKDKENAFSNFEDTLTLKTLEKTTEVIISLTSFPDRIPYLGKVLESLIKQSVKADRILLWLADSQFPNREQDLPEDILQHQNKGVEIRWCDDLRPHKKYFYTMQEYPDSIVITVDDDVYYHKDLVKKLLRSYQRFPYAVSAMRAHQIRCYQNGSIKPYANWKREVKNINYPSLALVATGVAGVLYPPNCLPKETFNVEMIEELCLNADDLWLKTMELINHVPVVLVEISGKVKNIDGSQDSALWHTNDTQGANDLQLKKIMDRYNTFCSEKDTLYHRIAVSVAAFESEKVLNASKLDAELRKSRKETQDIMNSRTYRIGMAVTYIPRKIRGGIWCCQENGFAYTIKYGFQKVMRKLGSILHK